MRPEFRDDPGADRQIDPLPETKRIDFLSELSCIAKTLRAMLKEIFDESSYQRFLDRAHLQSCPEAYEAFRQENEQASSRRPRCC